MLCSIMVAASGRPAIAPGRSLHQTTYPKRRLQCSCPLPSFRLEDPQWLQGSLFSFVLFSFTRTSSSAKSGSKPSHDLWPLRHRASSQQRHGIGLCGTRTRADEVTCEEVAVTYYSDSSSHHITSWTRMCSLSLSGRLPTEMEQNAFTLN